MQHFTQGVYTDVAEHVLSEPVEALPHQSDEYDQVVADWLCQWSIELIHVRHLAWHSGGLVDVANTLGIPLVKSFHDFYTLCPTVKLLDQDLNFCAGVCTSGVGKCQQDAWPAEAFYDLKHHQIKDWRQLFGSVLQGCDAFVTTTQDTKALILKHYPVLSEKPFAVIPHGRAFEAFRLLAPQPRPGEALRVLVPGNISAAKGGLLLAELARAWLPSQIEFHVAGKVSGQLDLPVEVVCHGPYTRDNFDALVEQIQPHVGVVLSIWPETWCHTLTELWACGVPVIGSALGAVGERLVQSQAGWVVPELTVAAISVALKEAANPNAWQQKHSAVVAWQKGEGKNQNTASMADEYWRLYVQCLPSLQVTAKDVC